MSKRNLYAKRQLQILQKQRDSSILDFCIIIERSRSREDTMQLTGFSNFISTIHKIFPDTEDWEWTEEQIQYACIKSGINRKSIITDQSNNGEYRIFTKKGKGILAHE